MVPLPVADYTTSRVLTIDYIRGEKITKLSPLVRTEIDGEALAEQLFRAYLQQILVDGFVHADPHPGNVFLTDDNRIALLDLGMVTHIPPGMQEKVLRLLLAVSEGRAEDAATVAITLGDVQPHFDEKGFRRDVADLVAQSIGATVGQMQVGRVVLVLARMSAERGIRVEPELTMLGKTLLNLDQVGRTLDPDFDPNAAIRRNASELMRQRVRKSLSPGNLFAGVMELKEFVENLPRRVNTILDHVANNSLEVKVDAIDEKMLLEGFIKVANRITMGLILASLIVGAALLMRVETTFRILGYPGLAIVCFFFAAAGGVTLVFNILWSDHKHRQRMARGGGGPDGRGPSRSSGRAAPSRSSTWTGSRVTNPSPNVDADPLSLAPRRQLDGILEALEGEHDGLTRPPARTGSRRRGWRASSSRRWR